MRRTVLYFSVLAMLTILFSGCKKHCDKLMDATCDIYGSNSRPCNEMKEMLKRTDSKDQKSCKLAIEIMEELGKIPR
jgi:hypothetical protein